MGSGSFVSAFNWGVWGSSFSASSSQGSSADWLAVDRPSVSAGGLEVLLLGQSVMESISGFLGWEIFVSWSGSLVWSSSVVDNDNISLGAVSSVSTIADWDWLS